MSGFQLYSCQFIRQGFLGCKVRNLKALIKIVKYCNNVLRSVRVDVKHGYMYDFFSFGIKFFFTSVPDISNN